MPYLGLTRDSVGWLVIFGVLPLLPVAALGGCLLGCQAEALVASYRTTASSGQRPVRTPLGDMNCDGRIDFADVNPFILALTDPLALQEQVGSWCFSKEQADCNFDGQVDFADIDPFVDFIMGVAEPPDRPLVIYWSQPPSGEKETQVATCEKMECGHPLCCVINSGEGTSYYCGWCEAEARAKHAEEQLATLETRARHAEALAEYWRRRCIGLLEKMVRVTQALLDGDDLGIEDQAGKPTTFESHLGEASRIVRTWPLWKQNLLGGCPDALGDADYG